MEALVQGDHSINRDRTSISYIRMGAFVTQYLEPAVMWLLAARIEGAMAFENDLKSYQKTFCETQLENTSCTVMSVNFWRILITTRAARKLLYGNHNYEQIVREAEKIPPGLSLAHANIQMRIWADESIPTEGSG
jgi:hypothetical protein